MLATLQPGSISQQSHGLLTVAEGETVWFGQIVTVPSLP